MQNNKRMRSYVTPKQLIYNAWVIYRGSQRKKTLIVEGENDEKLIKHIKKDNASIVISNADGKPNVIRAWNEFNGNTTYAGQDFIYFLADIDYDLECGKEIISCRHFGYSSIRNDSGVTISDFNDMDSLLFFSPGLKRVLIEININPDELEIIRNKIAEAATLLGCYRIADEVIQKKEMLTRSILDGITISDVFFDQRTIKIDQNKLEAHFRTSSPRKDLIQDLFEEARKIYVPGTNSRQCRGHDMTIMLSQYAEVNTNSKCPEARIESLLRATCEKEWIKNTFIGIFLQNTPLIEHLNIN